MLRMKHGYLRRLLLILFSSSSRLCLHQAGRFTSPASPIALKRPTVFILWRDKMAYKYHCRWSLEATMSSPPRSMPALSSTCTPHHPCPFYRSLSLRLRGLHIIPNQSWSTSLSQTIQRRMVVRDGPTSTADVAY